MVVLAILVTRISGHGRFKRKNTREMAINRHFPGLCILA